MCSLNVLGEAEIHNSPKTWRKWIPLVWDEHGKTQTIPQIFLYLTDLELTGTHKIPNFWDMHIPVKQKYSAENHIISRLWVFEEMGSS